MVCIHKLGVTNKSTGNSKPSENTGFKGKLRNTLITIAGDGDDDDEINVGGGKKVARQERDKFQNLDDIDEEESRSWASKREDSDNHSMDDEVPLTTIKVKTDLKMKESRREEGDDIGQYKVGKDW